MVSCSEIFVLGKSKTFYLVLVFCHLPPKRRPDVSAFGFCCSKEKFFACHAKKLVCAPLMRHRCTAVATLLPGRPHRAAFGTERAAPPLPLRRLRCAAAVTAAAAPLSEPTVLRRCRG